MNPVLPRVRTNLAGILPGVTPSAAQGARLLHDARLAPVWRALDDDADLHWAPAAGPGTGRRYEATLECEHGSALLSLASDDDALAAVAAANAGTALQSLALGVLFELPLERLAAMGLPGLRIARLVPASAASAAGDGWATLRRDGRELCRAALRELPPRMAQALRAAHGPSGRARSRTLRVPGTLTVSERRLRVQVLRSLARGDVLLLGLPGDAPTLDGAPANLRIGAGARVMRAAGRLDETTFTLLGDPFMTDHDTVQSPDTDVTAPALDALEVPVHFELETVSIALADLESIEPGYVIELATPASQARLRLVSCGVVIGEADLVAVGGQLGARITNMVSAS